MGTTDRPATRLERNWRRALSSAWSWRTVSSHERDVAGLKGEHGLNMWYTFRLEPWSSASQFGFEARVFDDVRRRREKRNTWSFMIVECRGFGWFFWWVSMEERMVIIYRF